MICDPYLSLIVFVLSRVEKSKMENLLHIYDPLLTGAGLFSVASSHRHHHHPVYDANMMSCDNYENMIEPK